MTPVRSCVLPACLGRREVPADSYACPDCHQRLVRKLGEIEGYLCTVTPIPGRPGDQGPRPKGFASSPPLRLEVVAMLDRRTRINGAGTDDVLDEVPNVHADLFGWLRILIEEHPDEPAPPTDLIAGVALLRSRCDWVVRQPWVDEFAGDIARVHGALRRVCGDAPGRPFAHCPVVAGGRVCGGWIAMFDDGSGARCRACRAAWRRDQLLDVLDRVAAVKAG